MNTVNTSKVNEIHLEKGTANLGYDVITIIMIEGGGWITHNGDDIALRQGETVSLEACEHPILISSLDIYKPITFTVAQHLQKFVHQLAS